MGSDEVVVRIGGMREPRGLGIDGSACFRSAASTAPSASATAGTRKQGIQSSTARPEAAKSCNTKKTRVTTEHELNTAEVA